MEPNAGRKRARPSSPRLRPRAELSRRQSSNSTSNLDSPESSVIYSPGFVSPPPLTNSKYRLAGGLDTPTAAASAAYDDLDCSIESLRYRSRRSQSYKSSESYFPLQPTLKEANGRPRLRSTSATSSIRPPANNGGWSSTVYNLASTVARGMWDFCRTSAFGGFKAGGGPAYDLRSASSERDWSDDEGTPASPPPCEREEVVSTPVPGQFPRDDSSDRDEQGGYFSPTAPLSPRRPSKRIHTDSGTGWVMVSPPPIASRETSPQRLVPRRTPSSSSVTHRPTSARAANRRSLAPISRRSSSNFSRSRGHSFRGSGNGGSQSGPTSPKHSEPSSPLAAEAQKFVGKRMREEREQERSMHRMSTQLQELIRQGKEALGTKFEVEDGA